MSSVLEPQSLRAGGERGFRFGELPADLARALPEWVETRTVAGGEVIKPDTVFRWRDYLVKFVPRGPRLSDRLGSNAAERSVRIHRRIAPIKSPRPWVAMKGASGLLVTDFIEGQFIEHFWRTDALAMERLVEFLVAMHRRGIFHGDFHAHNMLWDGRDWYLIDLEGVRHPLRTLFRRRLIEDHWGRLYFCLALAPELEPYFQRYLELSGLGWNAERAWRRVAALGERFATDWGYLEA